MEGVTFLERSIQNEFKRFVEVRLHTDGRGDKLDVSQRNKRAQQQRFKTVSIPYYAVLSPDGTQVYWKGGGVIDAEKFLAGLKRAP